MTASSTQTLDELSHEESLQQITSTLRATLGDTLVGIASFDEGEHAVVYRDDSLSEGYTVEDIEDILENIQLESLGNSVYEDYHGQDLHATIRVYDSLATFIVPITETTGVVIAVRRDGTHGPYPILESIENSISSC